ncbi:phosphatidylinositol kinase- protein kinase tor1, partial [Tulasnella sp. UAMH 9824]
MSSEGVSRLWNDHLNHRLFHLIHSNNVPEMLGGIAAIDTLLSIEGPESPEAKKNLYRLYNYVKYCLPWNDMNVMIAASKTLGRIAEIGGSAFGDHFVDFEVPRALQLLSGDKENGRYAAVLILRELARHTPGHFYPYVTLVVEKIWIVLRDIKPAVREGASELLAACLDIVLKREGDKEDVQLPIFNKLYHEAQTGFRTGGGDTAHGSLLAVRELFTHAGSYMRHNFQEAADTILNYRDHKDPLIRRTVIYLIPTLALYWTDAFTDKQLHKAMGHLLSQLKKNEKDLAFEAIGHVASAVGSDMKVFLEPIMANVKDAFTARGKKGAASEEAVFHCLAMLAEAVGPNLTKLLHDQLDLMFQCGLTEPFVTALVSISKHIPPLLKTVQERLLDLLSLILSGYNYKPLGAPAAVVRVDLAPTPRDATLVPGTSAAKTPELLTLALNTLSSFDFTGHVLN